MRIAAVITVFTILISTTVPAFANDDDEVVNFLNFEGETVFTVPADEFVLEDYVIPYEDYLMYMSGDGPSTFNAATGVLGYSGGMAWNAELAALGKTCASGGLYLLGYLALAGGVAYGVNGLAEMYRNGEFEQFYEDICTLYNNLSADAVAWLEDAFTLYTAGQTITVPVSVSIELADLINGSVMTDSAGNGIDTSIVIDAAIIGGAFDTTFPESIKFNDTDNTEPLLVHFDFVDAATAISSVVIGGLTLNKYATPDGNTSGRLTITNNSTGASLDMPWGQFNYGRPDLTRLSKFYKVVAGAMSYWTLYGQYTLGGTGYAYTPEKHTKYLKNDMVFQNTGTILDGLVITGVVWDAVANSWRYVTGKCDASTEITDDNSFLFPVDPIGLVLSNTGVGALPLPGTATFPWGGTAEPNEDDKEVDIPFIPPVPYIPPVGLPIPGTGTGTIGVPVTDTLTNTQVKVDTAVDTGVLEKDISVDLSTPQMIKDFIANIPDFFSGLFSWLPDDFENKLDGVWITLSIIVGLMVVVKIIDIIWP